MSTPEERANPLKKLQKEPLTYKGTVLQFDKEPLHCPICKSTDIIIIFGIIGSQALIQNKGQVPQWDDADINITDPETVECHSCKKAYSYDPGLDKWNFNYYLEEDQDEDPIPGA